MPDDDIALACLAEDHRRCGELGRIYDSHVCIEFDHHDGLHECACGHRWADRDE